MISENYDTDDSISLILKELSTEKPIQTAQSLSTFTPNSSAPTIDTLEEFILNNGAQTVGMTQEIIGVLLEQIQINPDAELITSVAEMVGSNNKALETLTKIYLNKEKLKQAKELEEFRQNAKIEKQEARPRLTREEAMALIYNDSSLANVKKPVN